MLLKEILHEYQGQQIKIGAETSFFYCEICDENIFDTIDKISNERYNLICSRLKRYNDYKDNFEQIWKEKIDKKIEIIKRNQYKKSSEKFKNLKGIDLDKAVVKDVDSRANRSEILLAIDVMKFEKADDYKSICNRIKKYERLKREFKPFLNREVIETYDAILYDCKIIRITGKEVGDYWDKDEYNAKNRAE